MDMMGKMEAVKKNFENLKEELDGRVFIETDAEEKLKITMTELATIKDIKVSAELLEDKEQLEDLLVITLNKALDKVKKNAVEEAKKTAMSSFSSLPGLGL